MFKKLFSLIFGKNKSQELLEDSIRRHQENADRARKETEEIIEKYYKED